MNTVRRSFVKGFTEPISGLDVRVFSPNWKRMDIANNGHVCNLWLDFDNPKEVIQEFAIDVSVEDGLVLPFVKRGTRSGKMLHERQEPVPGFANRYAKMVKVHKNSESSWTNYPDNCLMFLHSTGNPSQEVYLVVVSLVAQKNKLFLSQQVVWQGYVHDDNNNGVHFAPEIHPRETSDYLRAEIRDNYKVFKGVIWMESAPDTEDREVNIPYGAMFVEHYDVASGTGLGRIGNGELVRIDASEILGNIKGFHFLNQKAMVTISGLEPLPNPDGKIRKMAIGIAPLKRSDSLNINGSGEELRRALGK
jgi:hypothetical protein